MTSIFDIKPKTNSSLTALAQAAKPAPVTVPQAPVTAPVAAAPEAPTTPTNSLASLNASAAEPAAFTTAPLSPDEEAVDWSNMPKAPEPGAPPEEITAYLIAKLRATRESITPGRSTLVELHTQLKQHPSVLPPEALGDITSVMKKLTAGAHQAATVAKSKAVSKAVAKGALNDEIGNALDGIGF